MKLFLVILLNGLSILSSVAESSRGSRGHRHDPNDPWMGVNLTWVEESTTAQLRDVPEGFGLLVESVESDSPAAAAGLQSLDVIWKLEDQLIANKWQLYSLLKMKGVGTEVEFSVFRGGETITLSLVIGKRPVCEAEAKKAADEMLMPPLPGSPMRAINYNARSGFIEDGDITVSVTRKPLGYEYIITEGEKEVAKGLLPSEDRHHWPESLDKESRHKLSALIESIQKAEGADGPTPRVPRVRRVPTPSEKSAE